MGVGLNLICGENWTGDTLAADVEAFPYADGTVPPGRKKARSSNIRPIRRQPEHGQEHRDKLQGEADDPDPATKRTRRLGHQTRVLECIWTFVFVIITLMKSKNSMCRTNGRFQSGSTFLMLVGREIRRGMCCENFRLLTIGTSMVTGSYLGRGPVLHCSQWVVNLLPKGCT